MVLPGPDLFGFFLLYFYPATEHKSSKPTQRIACITVQCVMDLNKCLNDDAFGPIVRGCRANLILPKNLKEYISGLSRPHSLFFSLQPDHATYSVSLAKSMLFGFKFPRQYVASLSWSVVRHARHVGYARALTMFLRLLPGSLQPCSWYYYA